eukprot:Protomagalhaensia_wolfi_Nauph_80__443@NODE_1247_length_1636_cov_429_710081_g960_i0_p1_GENE_NODE_1247_length_1636_cov_429_710081_g960_i0NODE_1247_length_1636_cov_429_710081_g960_i0_p1_ORF_typecomplete_len396_score44_98DUF485/PF04341_12/4DUF485/PF04341_12/2_1e03DUF485/PF04341_12/0_028Cyt_bd_oxida_II/PF02322_15/0_66Cyt_bd_oxida_II/PF02322_15/1_3CPP1like/PF11833_8/95CPP1like/PF11833_8/0_95MTABC_N/PF16185_5/0_12MTABC_N/PF16185_5/2_3e02DUF1129/PF06570_11/15DUF1129/PF06570_11/6_7DUF4199/PF13858_6/0_49D
MTFTDNQPPIRKSSTLSTQVNSPDRTIYPSREPQQRPSQEDIDTQYPQTSPVKWGFLIAALIHTANTFISGLTSAYPWSCIHGSVNAAVALLLGYIVLMWNSRFNANLYVRRTLLRLSWSISTLMSASFMASMIVVISVYASGNTLDPDTGLYHTSIGNIRRHAAWQPGLSAVLGGLWAAFAWVQHVAVENIRGAQLPISRSLRNGQRANVTTTIAEEIASIEGPTSHPPDSVVSSYDRFVSDSLIYYGPMLGAALIFWSFGTPLTMGAPFIAVAGYVGTVVSLSLVTFTGLRSRFGSLIMVGLSAAWTVTALFLNILRNAQTAQPRVRWTVSVLMIACQIAAAAASIYWYLKHAERAREEDEKAPVTLFRRRRDPSADDPMDYFMAGMAHEENV